MYVRCGCKKKESQAQAQPCGFLGQPQTLALKAQLSILGLTETRGLIPLLKVIQIEIRIRLQSCVVF